MKYYEIDIYERHSEDYCVIDRPPEEIHTLSSYIMKGRSALQKYPDNVVAKMSDRFSGRVCTDFIANRELSLIVSERVKDVIAEHCSDDVEYLSLSIMNHKKRIEEGKFYYINPIGSEDVLDYDTSDIVLSSDNKVIKVRTFVFDQKKLGEMPKHLFRVKEWPKKYFMSEYLVNKINNEIDDVQNFNTILVKTV